MKDKSIEQLASEYANSIVPNPDKYDAPYYTTRDKHEDVENAFIAGYQQAQQEPKWVYLPIKELLDEGYYAILLFANGFSSIKVEEIKNGIIPYHYAIAYYKVELPTTSPNGSQK